MTTNQSSEWGVVEVSEGQTARLRFGPLEVLVRRSGEEIWVAHHPLGEVDESDPPADELLSWTRWSHRDAATSIQLLPALPDRLVVVSPEVPFHLAPGAHARVYVRIPLWATVRSRDSTDRVLAEAPTVELSDTWWGDVADGELGYWLPTSARRRLSSEIFVNHLAVCPLELTNRSDQVLPVEKFALRVAHLPIYRDGHRLWGAETRVMYENDEEGSRIEITESPPREAERATLMSPPREPLARGFRALTFRRFRHSPGL